MTELTKALIAADEAFLVGMANKGLYKRAQKDLADAVPVSTVLADSAAVDISGEKVEVRVPLAESKCSCVSRTVCRHIIAAILSLKENLPDDSAAELPAEPAEKEKAPEPAPQPAKTAPAKPKKEEKTLTERDIKKINSCAARCLDMLGDILVSGIVRISENVPDNTEVAAVQCHALKMADGERAMRDISSRLGDCLARRASFDMKQFTDRFCHTAKLMEKLTNDDISTDSLGTFRQDYVTSPVPLTLMPIGKRQVAGGDYEGDVYYFFNPESAEQPFLSLSDLRPTFYDSVRSRGKSSVLPWGLAVPLDKMMKKKLVLVNAKVSEGKLSQSQETVVALTTDCDLNCDEIRDIIYTDFRKAVVELYERRPRSELDRLMIVHPHKCIRSDFDKAEQVYTLTVEDVNGFQADISIKYRRETKHLIETVEKIAEKMLAENLPKYNILAVANIKNDRLTLYPVEIYDFIDAPYPEDYDVPEVYLADSGKLRYTAAVATVIDEVADELEIVLQCGLRSGTDRLKTLENACFNYGLKGLSRMWRDFAEAAEAYRHNTRAESRDILMKMADIHKYVSTAEKRLEIILSLNPQITKEDIT